MRHTIYLKCEVELVSSADSSVRNFAVTFSTEAEGDIVGHSVARSLTDSAGRALADALAELALLGEE